MVEPQFAPSTLFNCSLGGTDYCNGGICDAVAGICDCRGTYTRSGDRCTVPAIEGVGPILYLYQFGWAAPFSALLVYITWRAVRRIKYNVGFQSRLIKASFTFLILFCLARSIWLLVDPHRINFAFPIVFEAILNGISIWLLQSFFIMIVCLWLEAVGKMDQKHRAPKILRNVLFALMVICGVLQVVQDTIRPLIDPSLTFIVVILYYIFIGGFTLVISISFLIYGRVVLRRLNQFKDGRNESSRTKLVRKVATLMTAVSALTIAFILILVLGIIVIDFIPTRGTTSFIAMQSVYRAVELAYVCIAMYYFKRNVETAQSGTAALSGSRSALGSKTDISSTVQSDTGSDV